MNKKQKKMLTRIVISAVLVVICYLLPLEGIWRFIAFMIPYVIIGYDILRKAFKGIMNKQVFDENFLMATATVGAICLGEYSEAVAVMLFYQIGELFQSYAVGKSRKNITELMDIRPDYANVEIDGSIEQVDPDEVEVGTIITVLPGEKIPMDGVIVEGASRLDTSALTGESVPRKAEENDEVISGCINLEGVLKIRTTREFGESTVSKILDLVENASSKKSRSEQFITRFAHYYTPVVCYSALALALLPPIVLLLTGKDPSWSTWIYRALTFLVISCPCALVISIPLSFFGGIGGASNQGILIKGSNYLEMLSQVDTLVFDKTGTITKGVFAVNEIEYCEDKDKLLEYAAHCECYSNHPIARSIKEAYGKDIDESRISDVQEISGHGITAKVDEVTVACGNDKLMKMLKVDYKHTESYGTVVYVAIDNKFAGSIIVSDVLKDNAEKAFKDFPNMGIKKTIMLSGDRNEVAQAIGKKLSISEVYGELLPQEKVDKLEEILSRSNTTAYVGDGINDAPALSRSDVGISMGALGSDAAIEAADVVLMDDDINKLPKAIRIARKCIRIVYENIYFAIGVKVICLILGALGLGNMWLAIFADVGVMVIAVMNAMRALNTRNI
ncbi:MAG: cadmium-translocating P-type ATPase [Erysipelotrichaceae bacterium]|nr:cadmium-translocating P-type ATPase [Erysipelotrichaceae bacterium]